MNVTTSFINPYNYKASIKKMRLGRIRHGFGFLTSQGIEKHIQQRPDPYMLASFPSKKSRNVATALCKRWYCP